MTDVKIKERDLISRQSECKNVSMLTICKPKDPFSVKRKRIEILRSLSLPIDDLSNIVLEYLFYCWHKTADEGAKKNCVWCALIVEKNNTVCKLCYTDRSGITYKINNPLIPRIIFKGSPVPETYFKILGNFHADCVPCWYCQKANDGEPVLDNPENRGYWYHKKCMPCMVCNTSDPGMSIENYRGLDIFPGAGFMIIPENLRNKLGFIHDKCLKKIFICENKECNKFIFLSDLQLKKALYKTKTIYNYNGLAIPKNIYYHNECYPCDVCDIAYKDKKLYTIDEYKGYFHEKCHPCYRCNLDEKSIFVYNSYRPRYSNVYELFYKKDNVLAHFHKECMPCKICKELGGNRLYYRNDTKEYIPYHKMCLLKILSKLLNQDPYSYADLFIMSRDVHKKERIRVLLEKIRQRDIVLCESLSYAWGMLREPSLKVDF